jgi:hypothetical protein
MTDCFTLYKASRQKFDLEADDIEQQQKGKPWKESALMCLSVILLRQLPAGWSTVYIVPYTTYTGSRQIQGGAVELFHHTRITLQRATGLSHETLTSKR